MILFYRWGCIRTCVLRVWGGVLAACVLSWLGWYVIWVVSACTVCCCGWVLIILHSLSVVVWLSFGVALVFMLFDMCGGLVTSGDFLWWVCGLWCGRWFIV